MAEGAEIIQFPARASVTAVSAMPSEQLQSVSATASVSSEISVRSERTLTVDQLYPDLDPSQSVLPSAFRLLDEAEIKLNDAAESAREGDLISADDAVQRFQALLPELFCCRSLGDSFGTVINALFHGLKNLNGLPVAEAQITQMLNSIKVLRRQPFLEYKDALAMVARLEATELRIDPQGFIAIQEVLLG